MPASPRINFRIPDSLGKKLTAEAKKRKISESECVRQLIAESLEFKGDATVPGRGRPKVSEKSK